LTLTTINAEIESASKHTESWGKAVDVAMQRLRVPREMGMERQLFLAQRLGLQGDMWSQISQIRFAQQKGEGPLFERMMKVVAGEAGLGGKAAGAFGVDESQKLAFFAEKIFGVSREMSERWALGTTRWKEQQASMQLGKEEQDKAASRQKQLNDQWSAARGWIEKSTKAMEGEVRALQTLTKSGSLTGKALDKLTDGVKKATDSLDSFSKKHTGFSLEQIGGSMKKAGGMAFGAMVPGGSVLLDLLFGGKKYHGGYIGYYRGGEVDNIPAMLTNGEGIANNYSGMPTLAGAYGTSPREAIDNLNAGVPPGGGNVGDVNINLSGIINQELVDVITPVIRDYFQKFADRQFA